MFYFKCFHSWVFPTWCLHFERMIQSHLNTTLIMKRKNVSNKKNCSWKKSIWYTKVITWVKGHPSNTLILGKSHLEMEFFGWFMDPSVINKMYPHLVIFFQYPKCKILGIYNHAHQRGFKILLGCYQLKFYKVTLPRSGPFDDIDYSNQSMHIYIMHYRKMCADLDDM